MRRRSFLAALGMAPIAGSAAVKQQAASLAGVPSEIGAMAGGLSGGWSGVTAAESSDGLSWVERLKRASFYVVKHGVPDWKRQELRRHIHVSSLDADLASNLSFSLSAKIRIQKDRLIAREIERLTLRGQWEEAEQKFTEATGISL